MSEQFGSIKVESHLPPCTFGVPYRGFVHGANIGGATGEIHAWATALPIGMHMSSAGDIGGMPMLDASRDGDNQSVRSKITLANGVETVTFTHVFEL